MLRSVFLIARKDLLLMSRDRMGMFFILGFPILMGLLFGLMYGGTSQQQTDIPVAVVDEDSSPASRDLLRILGEIKGVATTPMERQAALDDVRKGRKTACVIVPQGYGATAGMPWEQGPAIQVGLDPSRNAEAGMLQGMLMQAAGKAMMTRFQDPDLFRPYLATARTTLTEDTSIPTTIRESLLSMMGSFDQLSNSIQTEQKKEASSPDAAGDSSDDMSGFFLAKLEQIDVTREYDPNSPAGIVRKLTSRWDISFPQAILWGALGCVASFAISLVRERSFGTLIRLRVSPMSPSSILIGKGLACFITVIGIQVVMIALGMAVGMRPKSLLHLGMAGTSLAVCFVGIMLATSVIGKTEEAVGGAGWGVNMIMAMFGGGMIPLAFMPSFMVTISHFSPVKWGILAIEGAVWRGLTFVEMLLPCGILIAIGIVGFLVGATIQNRQTD